MIHYTIYISKAAAVTDPERIQSTVDKWKEKNLNAGISGILFYKDSYYMQYLEGSREGIDSLLSVIRADPRNSEVNEILSGVSQDKLFRDGMQFINLEKISGQESALHGIRADNVNLPELIKDTSQLMDFVNHFAA